MARGRKRTPELTETRIAADPLLLIAQALVLLQIVLTMWVFDPSALDAFALPKSALGHSLTVALAVTLFALLVRHGRGLLTDSYILAVAAFLLAVMAVASTLALDTTVALFGTWRRYLGLTQVIGNVVLLTGVALAFRTARDRGRILVVSMATLAVVAAYAFLQRLGIDFVVYKNAANAVVSTVGQPDILGAFAAVGASCAFAVAVLSWARLSAAARSALMIVGAAAVLVGVLTGVRAGALGLAAGWAAIILVLALRRRSGDRRLAAGVLAAGGILAVIVAISPVGQRLTPGVLATDPAVRSRLEIWDTAARIVAARPLLGVGPDNFANLYPAMRSELSELVVPGELQNSTHSWFWYAATSAGAVGAAAMLLFAAVVVARGVQLARLGRPEAAALVPAIAYLGQGLVGVNDLSLDWTLWVSAGVLAGTVAGSSVARAHLPSAQGLRQPVVIVATLAIAAALVFGAAGTIARVSASRALGLGQAYIDVNAGAPAVPLTRDALAADPRRAMYWASYGAALADAGADAASVEAFIVATRVDPTYPSHWLNLAIELGRLGNVSGAYAAVQRAVKADPYNPESLDLFAQLSLARGDPERSVVAGAEAAKLDPFRLSRYDAPVLANLSLQRFAEAERLLAQAFDHGGDGNSFILLRRAQLYAATNRKDLALKDLDRALALDPKNTEAAKLRQDLTR